MSSNTPLPVPSKAAIRALRGLVLGTSCTLALVTEDRRRRINAAHSAIRNGDRLRSARRYKSGGSAMAIALEEDAISSDSGMIHWGTFVKKNEPQASILPGLDAVSPRRQTSVHDTNTSSTAAEGLLAAATNTNAVPELSTQPTLRPFSSPHPPRIQQPVPSLARQAKEYRSRAPLTLRCPAVISAEQATAKCLDKLPARVAEIQALTDARNASDLEAAVKALEATLSQLPTAAAIAVAASLHDVLQPLWDASSALCRACQEAGRMDLAQGVLQMAIRSEQLTEDAYFAHMPLPVVESLAPLHELKVALSDGLPAATGVETAARRDAFIRRLRAASSLFLPSFSSTPESHEATEFLDLGRHLLECAFAVGHRRLIKNVFLSIARYPGDISEFTQWYISQLQKFQSYNLVASSFLARPPTAASLSDAAFFKLGDAVVEAVRLGHSPQPQELLLGLLQLTSPDRRLRTAWVTELIYQHWQKFHDYAKIQDLFGEVATKRNISETIYFPNGVYRVMIQISLEADDPLQAKTYFDELVSTEPSAATNIRILGLFALSKAKAGDWTGVRDLFEEAASAAAPNELPPRDTERVFVPIAKEYIQTHTIGETEGFIKSYAADLHVPLCRELVTLLANEYGALKEVRSFVSWLEYCASAGFKVDAAFSNAILHNCRKHWKLKFQDLRKLYLKLRSLNPNFEDDVTQSIMRSAAISDAKHHGRYVNGRVGSLRIASRGGPQPTLGAFVSPLSTTCYGDGQDLYTAMKQTFACGQSGKTLRIYKQAMRNGEVPSERCLKLAVSAALKGDKKKGASKPHTRIPSPERMDAAIAVLKEAHAAGQDIDSAATYIALTAMDTIGPSTVTRNDKEGVAAALQTILSRLETAQIRISDMALNRAAFHLFKAGHMRGAIALGLSAADTPVGGGRPGYNAWNYSVLVSAFARLEDAKGIRLATEGAAATSAYAATMSYKVLKQARRDLSKRGMSPGAKEALQAVEDALQRARVVRQKLNGDRHDLESATVDIMRKAALDAGCEPVDFDEEPFPPKLTDPGKKGKKTRQNSLSNSWEMLEAPASAAAPLVVCTT